MLHSARAMLMRWRWPPDNWPGSRAAKSADMPTSASSSRVRASRSSQLACRLPASIAWVTMLATRRRGLSADCGSWNTICRLAARRAPLRSDGSVRSSPLSRIRPRRRLLEPDQHLGDGALAAAAFADQGDEFVLRNAE